MKWSLTGFLLFAVMAFSTSCKTKEVVTKKDLRYKSADFLFGQLAKKEMHYKWLSAKVAVKLKSAKGSNSFSVRLRMLKDSVIWASITPALGIEVARVYITPDSLIFMDRINSKYFQGGYEMINKLLDTEIDFDMLEAIITGNNFTLYKNDKFESAIGKDHYLLSTIRRRQLKKEFKDVDSVRIIMQNIWLNPITFKIDRMALKDVQSNKKVDVNYSDFKEMDGQLFPTHVDLDIKARPDDNASAELDFSKIELEKRKTFHVKFRLNTNQSFSNYRMSKCLPHIFLMFLLIGSLPASSQQRDELEKKKKKLEQDIQYTNKLIEETTKNKEASLNQLNLLNTKISIRQELINTVVKEVNLLNKQISETGKVVESMENDLKKLKEEYSKMIYYAYKNKSYYDRVMFIFSAKDFNQAYMRLKYMQEYAKYREKQAQLIKETEKALSAQIKDYEKQKKEKSALLTKSEEEKLKLTTEMGEKNQLVQSLQDKEKELKKALRKKQAEADKLQKAIEEAIKKEIEEARKRAEAEAAKTGKKVEVTSSGFALTPAEIALSGSFANNKGKIPWPVERGNITELFGEHPHKVLPGIKVKNNGSDITTQQGEQARASFEGKVTAIISIPGQNKAVMIRHGEFLTVYSNLISVSVNMNDEVSLKQNIGTIATDHKDGQTTLHFEIWKGKTLLDPSDWLLPKK